LGAGGEGMRGMERVARIKEESRAKSDLQGDLRGKKKKGAYLSKNKRKGEE